MRQNSMFRSLICSLAATASIVGVAGGQALPALADTPFTALAGSWSGGGQIRLDDGNSERLTCRALYNSKDGGASLGLSLRCASTSYKIELRSSLQYDAGKISGSWEERTFNASGEVSGKAANGAMVLAFSGNVTGSMSVTYGGSSQTVSLKTSGSNLSGLTLSLSKG